VVAASTGLVAAVGADITERGGVVLVVKETQSQTDKAKTVFTAGDAQTGIG